MISISTYIHFIQSALWKCNLQDKKRIYTLVWKSIPLFLFIQSYCIFFLLNQWECSNIINRFVLKKVLLFSRCLWCERNLHKVCDIFFCLFHVVWCMITHFFINIVYWVKTCVFSPLMVCRLLLKDQACIFLCEIFVLENGKELHCR